MAVDRGAHGVLHISVLHPSGIVTGQGGGPARGDGILRDRIPGLPDVASIERDLHGHNLVRVKVLDQVDHASAPADSAALMGHACLPLLKLIAVRIESEWKALQILRHLRLILDRFDQGAYVRDESGAAGLEKMSDLRQSVMRAECSSRCVERVNLDQLIGRFQQRQVRTAGGIFGVGIRCGRRRPAEGREHVE